MEYAIRLTSVDDSPADARATCPPAWRALLPDGATVALYFGSEFCEERRPGTAEAIEFCDVAHARGWEPTLATPIVTTDGLAATDRLLAALTANGRRVAVVFNDWGVLRLLRERHPALARRAGRLLNRSLRDPRAYRDAPSGTATHDPNRYTRVRELMVTLGVSAMETDTDLEGGWLGDGAADERSALKRALHVPFSYAASGRACPLKAALYPERGFAKSFAQPCSAPCRGKPLAVSRPDTPLPHWRAGNTMLYEVPIDAARGFVERADRIVVHAMASP